LTSEAYVEAYREHYRKNGKVASGTGEYVRKLELWYRIGYTDEMTVLDYGCGWGAMVRGIKNPSLYHGVDIVPEAVDLARIHNPGVSFDVFEIGSLDAAPADFVCAQSVFTHALREDAPICLEDIFWAMNDEGFGLIDILHKPGHENLLLRYYDPKEWSELLEYVGFEGGLVDVIEWPTATHYYYKVVKT
jgi:trans-aconitate methyltransferase